MYFYVTESRFSYTINNSKTTPTILIELMGFCLKPGDGRGIFSIQSIEQNIYNLKSADSLVYYTFNILK